MRRLQPPPTREGRGNIGQDAARAALRIVSPPFPSPSPPASLFHFTSLSSRCNRVRYFPSVWNCVVLSAPFVLNTSCGMNAAMVSRRRDASLGIKGFVLLQRRAERGTETGERDLNSVVVVSSHNGRIAKLSESCGR